jgi:hypothetical protein
MANLKSILSGVAGKEEKLNRNEVEKLAYELYVKRGYENGKDVQDWLTAESLLKKRR